jgi:hypothetical protein
MTKNKIKVLVVSAFLLVIVCCTQTQQPPANNSSNTNIKTTEVATGAQAACAASADWLSNPQNAPKEITGTGQRTICQFHQFSWQTFLALMNQPQGAAERAFEDEKNFPLLLAKGENSCGENAVQSRLFVRTVKDDNGPHDDFILPERIDQAAKTNEATIYDQNGNVVFYEVRFSRTACDPQIDKMFPDGTTELKVSYRVITEAEKSSYVWINPEVTEMVDGKPKTEKKLLGMIGFHLMRSTPEHPEFIWASFEHKQTAPECQSAAAANAPAWTFTSQPCAAQLPNSVDPKLCNFNLADTHTALSGGKPTQICKVYHAGSKPGDFLFDQNVAAIDSLNAQLTGPDGMLAKLSGSSLSVLQNYQLIGSLWLIDPKLPSQQPGKPTTDTSNQVGSLQLANPTMETTFQQFKVAANGDATPVGYTGNKDLQPAANCFFCHRYEPGFNVKTSHIFADIKGQPKPNSSPQGK